MAGPFPEIVAALKRSPTEMVLDGELIVPGVDGRSDFEELRRRNLLQRPATIHEAAAKNPAVLVVLDLLAVGDEDLRSLPLRDRRERKKWREGGIRTRSSTGL